MGKQAGAGGGEVPGMLGPGGGLGDIGVLVGGDPFLRADNMEQTGGAAEPMTILSGSRRSSTRSSIFRTVLPRTIESSTTTS